MKQYCISLLSCLLLTVFFFSCEQELEFSGEETKPLLVLNAVLSPDIPINAELTKSRFFLDNTPIEVVSDGTVQLYRGTELIETLTFVDSTGRYHGTYLPQVGERLQLHASAPKMESITAEETVPQEPEVLSVEVTDHSKLYWERNAYYDSDWEYVEEDILRGELHQDVIL
ncbi:DUF4249 domain-containing protein, partial [Bacteroidales bacterium OttesenSCG-928-J19]|nr:DUF4249 domain-containing protein [Bacteroidales bacterium OttesenSCG-928-J19]